MSYTRDPRVDAYIDALPEWQQAICREVRDLVHAAVRLGASDQPITPRSRSSARLSGLPLAATGTPGTAVIV
jgi:hypothetical protein